MAEDNNGFYKTQFFKELSDRFDRIETALSEQNVQIAKINNKLSSILGWAAGAGAVAGIVFTFIKDKLTRHI